MSYLVLALKVLIKMSAIWGICAAAFFLILAGHKKNVEMINIEVKEVA